MIEYIIKKITEADMILLGVGEELDILNRVRKKCEKPENAWMLPYMEKLGIEEEKESKSQIYQHLASWLKEKNYFIITLCQDGLIRGWGLDDKRIVEPCGGYEKLQCSRKCSTELYDLPENLLYQIRDYTEGKLEMKQPDEPVCPFCGNKLVFNNVNAENYVEEGYLDKWSLYKKWLQGTVNKNIVLLEIGVGMKYPTVIRWPFEKITFYNQKAELFRVHSRIYQMTEELKERGHGIRQNPEEFLKELSKGF